MKTVSNRIALHCLNHCQREGRDPAQLLQEAGIAREELLLPHGRIDAQRHFRLLTQVAPHVDLAHKWSPPSLSGLFADYLPLASLCCNAANLRQALHFFLAYRPLIGECDRIVLREEEGEARLSYHSESDHPDVIAMCSLANLGYLYALLQFYHPGQGLLVLPTPVRPKLWRELASWLGERLQRGERFELRFPASLLDLAHGQCNLPLQPLLLGELDGQMRLLRPSSHYRERVLGLIRQQLWQECVDSPTLLAGVCDALRLTRWTLNRHLREEGCHFSALLEQVRREEACRLLQDPTLQLQEVGGRLGFASQSSFSRFFREAFALSPREFRSRRSRL
ncbi:helix-turn-helix transcriptional regulator [Aeromonas hydrophila]|uniref:helix-turn-helix transcriptional regulator n=1 Tax=Aeromonas hydrophila TaxID=644 RepID=UPI0021E6ACFF|nr:AraC family transcriptional regulator [Aeromonas hydrophila]MCV3276686.1 AraC family transcriptional regulator [Aeromonas hydrophila]